MYESAVLDVKQNGYGYCSPASLFVLFGFFSFSRVIYTRLKYKNDATKNRIKLTIGLTFITLYYTFMVFFDYGFLKRHRYGKRQLKTKVKDHVVYFNEPSWRDLFWEREWMIVTTTHHRFKITLPWASKTWYGIFKLNAIESYAAEFDDFFIITSVVLMLFFAMWLALIEMKILIENGVVSERYVSNHWYKFWWFVDDADDFLQWFYEYNAGVFFHFIWFYLFMFMFNFVFVAARYLDYENKMFSKTDIRTRKTWINKSATFRRRVKRGQRTVIDPKGFFFPILFKKAKKTWFRHFLRGGYTKNRSKKENRRILLFPWTSSKPVRDEQLFRLFKKMMKDRILFSGFYNSPFDITQPLGCMMKMHRLFWDYYYYNPRLILLQLEYFGYWIQYVFEAFIYEPIIYPTLFEIFKSCDISFIETGLHIFTTCV
jgi:hypothetical protein